MSKIIRWLLIKFIKRNPDIRAWSISVDEHTDIDIQVHRYV